MNTPNNEVLKGKKQEEIAAIGWLVFCAAALTAFIIFKKIGYEGNDDRFLALIPGGIWGRCSPYTIHNNIAIGAVLAFLSRSLPFINWTVCFYLLMITMAYMLSGYWLIRRTGVVRGTITSAILYMVTFASLYFRMNYSKSGAFAGAVGMAIMWLLTEDCPSEMLSRRALLPPAVLTVLGFLVRYKTSLALAPFFLLLMVFGCSRFPGSYGEGKSRRSLVWWLSIVLIIILLWLVDFGVYHSDPEWVEFRKFNDYREKVMDYYLPHYSDASGDYDAINLSGEDTGLLESWIFADSTVFNSYNMIEIKAMADRLRPRHFTPGMVKYYLLDIFKTCRQMPIFIIVLLMTLKEGAVLVLWMVRRGRAGLGGLLLPVVSVGTWGELLLLAHGGRLPERAVMVPLMTCIVCLLIGNAAGEKEHSSRYTTMYVAVLLLVGIAAMLPYNEDGNQYITEYTPESRAILEELSTERETLYVWSPLAADKVLSSAFLPMEGIPGGLMSNSCLMGGWPIPSPDQGDQVEPYGGAEYRHNPIGLLAVSPQARAIVMKDEMDVLLAYIRLHYNKDADINILRALETKAGNGELYVIGFAE